ncbi:Myosin-M heavy chain [Amphibalanus amphitrite]|uniref:Myosin-M heavy chain n=1 Tax=Amphibalanus amphitrite TaxID=1232801 RepID=A0A6A4VD62_AMPAM|nr:Myosin-M heavy chain [Amphibalanus amphitrite]
MMLMDGGQPRRGGPRLYQYLPAEGAVYAVPSIAPHPAHHLAPPLLPPKEKKKSLSDWLKFGKKSRSDDRQLRELVRSPPVSEYQEPTPATTSALGRSMRYAEAWLADQPRRPPSQFAAPVARPYGTVAARMPPRRPTARAAFDAPPPPGALVYPWETYAPAEYAVPVVATPVDEPPPLPPGVCNCKKSLMESVRGRKKTSCKRCGAEKLTVRQVKARSRAAASPSQYQDPYVAVRRSRLGASDGDLYERPRSQSHERPPAPSPGEYAIPRVDGRLRAGYTRAVDAGWPQPVGYAPGAVAYQASWAAPPMPPSESLDNNYLARESSAQTAQKRRALLQVPCPAPPPPPSKAQVPQTLTTFLPEPPRPKEKQKETKSKEKESESGGVSPDSGSSSLSEDEWSAEESTTPPKRETKQDGIQPLKPPRRKKAAAEEQTETEPNAGARDGGRQRSWRSSKERHSPIISMSDILQVKSILKKTPAADSSSGTSGTDTGSECGAVVPTLAQLKQQRQKRVHFRSHDSLSGDKKGSSGDKKASDKIEDPDDKQHDIVAAITDAYDRVNRTQHDADGEMTSSKEERTKDATASGPEGDVKMTSSGAGAGEVTVSGSTVAIEIGENGQWRTTNVSIATDTEETVLSPAGSPISNKALLFNDTMRLHMPVPRPSVQDVFSPPSSDGGARRSSIGKSNSFRTHLGRPREPPPPPPEKPSPPPAGEAAEPAPVPETSALASSPSAAPIREQPKMELRGTPSTETAQKASAPSSSSKAANSRTSTVPTAAKTKTTTTNRAASKIPTKSPSKSPLKSSSPYAAPVPVTPSRPLNAAPRARPASLSTFSPNAPLTVSGPITELDLGRRRSQAAARGRPSPPARAGLAVAIPQVPVSGSGDSSGGSSADSGRGDSRAGSRDSSTARVPPLHAPQPGTESDRVSVSSEGSDTPPPLPSSAPPPLPSSAPPPLLHTSTSLPSFHTSVSLPTLRGDSPPPLPSSSPPPLDDETSSPAPSPVSSSSSPSTPIVSAETRLQRVLDSIAAEARAVPRTPSEAAPPRSYCSVDAMIEWRTDEPEPDHIYEEIPERRQRPRLRALLQTVTGSPALPARRTSMFGGASRAEILSYLQTARERQLASEPETEYGWDWSGPTSSTSDTSEEGRPGSAKMGRSLSAEVERTDSGVGSETSKGTVQLGDHDCDDCLQPVPTQVSDSGELFDPSVCGKCEKKRQERKEILTEIVETELKYGRDLRVMLEEFYRPMLVAGLLTHEQLSQIFLNVEELLEVSRQLTARLKDALETALNVGDDDLLSVSIGDAFLDGLDNTLRAFETYCTKQGAASLLLASLEKERELLRVFLKVSQMENSLLRRMNLSSFLMVPIQRVTKYPLLLSRLRNVTPASHESSGPLAEAQERIELHLEHMNATAKESGGSRIWRRISMMGASTTPMKRSVSEQDITTLRLRKFGLEVLDWAAEDSTVALEGRLLYTLPAENNWTRRGRFSVRMTAVHALLVTRGGGGAADWTGHLAAGERTLFPRTGRLQQGALLLVKDRSASRMALVREPLFLDKCIVCTDPEVRECFEIHEHTTKESLIVKAEDGDRTDLWLRHLQYLAQRLGTWRKRRNGLANIMIGLSEM